MSPRERQVRCTAGRAADKVAAGWCRGSYKKLRGGRTYHCAVGAIRASTRDMSVVDGIERRAMALIHTGLIHWNDDPTRRKKDVVELLRRVAAGEGR